MTKECENCGKELTKEEIEEASKVCTFCWYEYFAEQ
jgi:hypothetical protein